MAFYPDDLGERLPEKTLIHSHPVFVIITTIKQRNHLYRYLYPFNNDNIHCLQPLYRSTYVSSHLQLRTGGFCWWKVLLTTCPC